MTALQRRKRFVTVVAAILVAAIVAAAGYSLMSLFTQGSGSRPAAGGAGQQAGTDRSDATTAALGHSLPTRLSIPAMGVDGALQKIGIDKAKNTLQQPPKPAQAAWFTGSRTPGQAGPTVIVGYISDGTATPAVFAKMAALKAGDQIRVRRADGATVVFAVDSVTEYEVSKVPTQKVFGNTAGPTLRIITCGGSLKSSKTATNVVVLAHMTGTE